MTPVADVPVRRRVRRSPPPRFGDAFRELRLRREWTQLELAVNTNVGVRTVTRLESGKHFPRADRLEKLCRGLGVSMDEIIALAVARAA